MKSERAKVEEFLQAVQQHPETLRYGTTIEWWPKTGAYRRCWVMQSAGPKMLLFSPKEARRMAARFRQYAASHGEDERAFADSHASDLEEMAEIAERMDRAKPTQEQAAAEYLGPSRQVH